MGVKKDRCTRGGRGCEKGSVFERAGGRGREEGSVYERGA